MTPAGWLVPAAIVAGVAAAVGVLWLIVHVRDRLDARSAPGRHHTDRVPQWIE